MCQGRQYHGWFGNGTCPDQGAKNGGRGPGDFDSRVRDVAYGAAASLPVRLRTRFSRQLHPKGLARLAALMRAWNGGASLDHAAFADRFFGRPADDPVVRQLRGVARQTDVAKSHDELREAATGLAAAVQAVGLDRWPRFLDDAEERAEQARIIPAQLAIPMPAAPGLPALPGIGPSEKETIAAAREIQRLLGRALQLLGCCTRKSPRSKRAAPDRMRQPSLPLDGRPSARIGAGIFSMAILMELEAIATVPEGPENPSFPPAGRTIDHWRD